MTWIFKTFGFLTNLPQLFVMIKSYLIWILGAIAAVALSFGIGFYYGKNYEEGQNAIVNNELIVIGIDASQAKQNSADDVAEELEKTSAVISAKKEKVTNEIINKKDVIDSGSIDDVDWVQLYNASAAASHTTPQPSR